MVLNFFRHPAFELIRFAIVGATATLIHATCGFAAVSIFGIGGLWANAIGFGCAWWVSFFGHHMFTFQSRSNPKEAFMRFILHSLAMFLVAFCVTAAAMRAFTFIPESFVPVIGAIVVPVISFLSSKFFVFRRAA